ncbi:uncharacterized protein LOC116166304 [Photinus pyralis]|uniref:uncharacterized protein LOC116159019 n=1 Tax=Photinus pyralis TaxID=7054 RepID=UPI001267271C|nr:uncharacterized protein LOC116159019 [Photinus pyralis]XP_031329634.1 uncharacterized protein LOC116160547 [Photinus pyralis]XP_031337086.1 uncharacterized protein LOC116166304 [Photinus pyralis]
MAAKKIYTVWSRDRERKTLILIDENDVDMYKTLILKASQKLQVDGSSLALESNGTPIDSEVLPYLNQMDILMLLEKSETWKSTDSFSVATGSTVTIAQSDISDLLLQPFPEGAIFEEREVHPTPTEKPDSTPIDNIDLTCKVDCNSEFLWTNFEIPLERLNSEQLENLGNGVRNKLDIKFLVQLIVNDMRLIKKVIPMKAFKIVAKKLIDRYPLIFRDVDEDGVVLGDGSHSLVSKLVERNNYLNRPHKRKSTEAQSSPIVSKKRVLSARAGCVNWSPEIGHHDSESISKLTENAGTSDEQFVQLLEKTYPQIRKVLNEEEPPFSKLMEEWPLLFSKKAIFWHFNKLTNSDIHLMDLITSKCNKITSFLKTKLKNDFDDTNLVEIRTITNITKYFKEDLQNLFLKCKDLPEITLESIPLSPYIIQTGEEENMLYFVYLERELVHHDGYTTFIEALKVSFSLFFILNLKYPRNLCATMELLQRMILKIHPDAGSKSKKVCATRKKVFNFMNSIKEG